MKHMTLEETVNMMSIRPTVILPGDEETARRKSIESHLVRLLSIFKRCPTRKNFNEVLQYTLPGYSIETRLSASRGITQNLQAFLREDDEDDEDSDRVGHREWHTFKESFSQIQNEGETDWQTISDLIRDADTSWAASHRPLDDEELESLITSVSQSQSSAAARARCLRILAKSLPADHPKLALFFQAIKDGLGQDRLVRLRHVACGVLAEVVNRPGWFEPTEKWTIIREDMMDSVLTLLTRVPNSGLRLMKKLLSRVKRSILSFLDKTPMQSAECLRGSITSREKSVPFLPLLTKMMLSDVVRVAMGPFLPNGSREGWNFVNTLLEKRSAERARGRTTMVNGRCNRPHRIILSTARSTS